MALKARTTRQASGPQEIPVPDITGGLDLRRAQTLMAPERARTLRNWTLEEPGALTVTPGYVRVSTAAIFAGRPQGGSRTYLANAVFTLLAGAGAVYKPDDNWVSTGAVYSSISTGNPVFFPHDRDLVMVMDGANAPAYSTNGTNWSPVGLAAPSTAATVSTLSSGALSSGEYAIAYTVKRGGTAHESNGSAESTIAITATTGAIHAVAGTTSADPTVTAYVWYARHKTPDLESVLRKVSSGAASTVRILSSAWTTNDEIPQNHDVPTVLSFGAIWKSRWWARDAVVGNRLRFTELFQPQSWPSLYYIDIPFEKGDSITAIQPLGDTLIIYGQSGKYLVIGQTALDFEVRPSVGSESGAFGPRAVMRVEQAAIAASVDNVATFDGATDRALEPDIAPGWRDLAQNVASSGLARVATIHDPQRHEARISGSRLFPTAAAGEWVLSLDRTRDNDGVPAWTTTDRDVAFYVPFHGNEATAGNHGKLFFLPSDTGHVYQQSTATAAVNSSNVRAEYEGAGLNFGTRQVRFIGTHVEFQPNDGDFSVDLVVDGSPQGSQAINIGGGLAMIGSAVIGTARIGGADRQTAFVEWPLGAEGHAAVFKGTYIGSNRFTWFSYTHTVLPEPVARRA
jgi:hypothetical protein